MREYKRSYFYIILCAAVILLATGFVYIRNKNDKKQKVETTVVASEPLGTVTEAEQENGLQVPSVEQNLDYAEGGSVEEHFKLEPIVKNRERDGRVIGTYAYLCVEQDDLLGLSREDYHDLIDQISMFSYDYFTIVLGNGKGIVYHPAYAYWGVYGTLDKEYYIDSMIHYIDAKEDEIELINADKVNDVKTFLQEATSTYKNAGWYKLEVEFLYDNIYQVELRINIKSDAFTDAKAAIKEIEQKSKSAGYHLKFVITCVNYGKEIVKMSFGEESPQYVYVKNGHRIALDSLE